MALAHIAYVGPTQGGHRFEVHTGSNPFFVYVVGRDPTRNDGVITLQDHDRVSALLRTDPRGRGVIDVPAEAFARTDSAVQVLSYRTEDLRGPAASGVVRPVGQAAWQPRPRTRTAAPAAAPSADHATAMFLDSVVSAITGLLPAVRQLLPGVAQLFGGVAAPSGPAPPAVPSSPAPASPAPVAPAVPAVPALPGTGAARAPDALSDIAALLVRPETRRLLDSLAAQIRSLSTGASVGLGRSAVGGPVYAEAKVFPAALLAALPSLMPLLQNVLSPQTIQSVLQTADPNRLLSTITAGLGDLAKIGIQADQANMAHLERLNPGLGDDFAERLLTSMSLEARERRGEAHYRRTERVVVDFVGLDESSTVGDEPVLAFSGSSGWRFTVAVRSPRAVPDARLTVRIEDRISRRTRFERTVPLTLAAGGTTATVDVPARVAAGLAPGAELHVRATVTWAAQGATWGSSRLLLVQVPRAATIGRVDHDGELVPLEDVAAFRPYWHRVWADDFHDGMRRVDLRVRYRYLFDPDVAQAVREPTRVEAEVPEGRWELGGAVSSGMRLGPAAIADLAAALTGERLDPAVLAACSAPGSVLDLGGSAQGHVRLRGRPGEQCAIWVWPEVRWLRLTVQRPGTVMPTGQVHSFVEEQARIPFPALAHVMGASS